MNYRTLEKIKIFSGLTAMAIIVMAWLYPVFFLLINANKTASEYAKGSKTEIIWGTSIFNNAVTAWNKGIGDGVLNSLLYGLAGSAIAVFFAFIAAYGIVRLKIKNGLIWFLILYSGTVFPFQMYLLPLFEAFVAVGIYKTKFGLILVYVGLCIPFATFVLRGFFLTVPWEIQEAAKIEGATNFQILYKVMMPMAKAPILLVFLIQFTWIWNDLLFGMVLSRSVGVRPITTVLAGMKDLYASMDGPTILTATVIASIPTLLIFLLLQKHFIRGLTLGSMNAGKG
jgi:ABC-type glycerol-3-phosphate transport system permease component